MDSTLGTTLVLAASLILTSGVSADDKLVCKERNACYCLLPDGNDLNLESLASTNSSAKFKSKYDSDTTFVYYNPCKPFNDVGECQEAAVCLEEKSNLSHIVYTGLIGKQDSTKWNIDGTTAKITYQYKERTFEVTLRCNETASDNLEILSISDEKIEADLTSKCACAGKCPLGGGGSSNNSKSISTGTILLILFFTFVILYLLGGIIYNKIMNGATGRELIPNVEFWTSLPRLVLDGISFTCNCCSKRRSSPGYDNVE